jgi:hypothetical protein
MKFIVYVHLPVKRSEKRKQEKLFAKSRMELAITLVYSFWENLSNQHAMLTNFVSPSGELRASIMPLRPARLSEIIDTC